MIHIKVPATSANLGPGFDTLGLALDLYHEVSIALSHNGQSSVLWHHMSQSMSDEENLVVKGIQAVFDAYSLAEIPYNLHMINCAIPSSRGLGSSAAAYVSGVIGGLYLAKLPLDRERVLEIATQLEGHPDNVAPAVFGGLVASCSLNAEVIHQRIALGKPLKFIALIPDFKLSTQQARAVLPQNYSKQDVVYSLGHLSVLLGAFLNGDFGVLRRATEDLLHQPHRMSLMPDTELLKKLTSDSLYYGGFVSGAGSTYMLMCEPELEQAAVLKAKSTLLDAKVNWQVKSLSIESLGASWEVVS